MLPLMSLRPNCSVWAGKVRKLFHVRVPDACDVEQISSEDEPILILPTDAKRTELDMTELEEL